MATSWKAAIVKEVKKVWLAIQGPDPKETIALYRETQVAERRESENLVVATRNLRNTTRRLAVLVWVLVGLTVVLMLVTAIQIYLTFSRGAS